ncbi:sensor histidine kinase [Jatrophihabitans fulvus]
MRVGRWSLARQLFALQALLSLVVVAAVAAGAVVVGQRRDDDDARARMLALASSVAANPYVVQQVATPDPTARLEPYAEQVRVRTGASFVVVMSPQRVRWTHPDRGLVGKRYVGTVAPALGGRAFAETYTGSLGPSVRAVAPVRSDGRVVALVSVGITVERIRDRLLRQLPWLAGGLLALLAVALLGSALVGRRLGRQTGGVDAATMSGVLAAHEAVLQSVGEGIVVVDRRGRVTVCNDRAAELLGLPMGEDVRDRPVADLPLSPAVRTLLTDEHEVRGELHLTGDRVLVVDRFAAVRAGHRHGTVTTLRDRTELESLTGELDATRSLAQSLHSQTHESANRLHTMVVLMETGRTDDAIRFGTEQLELSQRLTDRTVAAVDEPVLAALLLGKVAAAAERGVRVEVEAVDDPPLAAFSPTQLTTVVGNLVDNAVDACLESPGPGRVDVRLAGTADGGLEIAVSDDGPGLPPEAVDDAFRRGWSTKLATTEAGRGLGLALVHQVVRQHGGDVGVGSSERGGARLVVRLPRTERSGG